MAGKKKVEADVAEVETVEEGEKKIQINLQLPEVTKRAFDAFVACQGTNRIDAFTNMLHDAIAENEVYGTIGAMETFMSEFE